MKKNGVLYIVLAILMLSQVYVVFQISDLKRTMQQTENRMRFVEEGLHSNIFDVYETMDERFAEKASLVASCGYEVGKLDQKTLTAPVTFQLQPKVLTETTAAFLVFGEETLPMEKKGTGFVLTKTFAIKDEAFPMIILEDKGIQQFETHSGLQVYSIKEILFSGFSPRFEGEWGGSTQEPYKYQMKGLITTGSSTDNEDNPFKEAKYVVTVEDTVVKTADVPPDGGAVELNGKFKMEKGQTLLVKVIAVDSLDFTHEYLVQRYVAGTNQQDEGYPQNQTITASDGTVVYDVDWY